MNPHLELSREVMFDIANRFDRLADILLIPAGEKHLHRLLMGAAAGAIRAGLEQPKMCPPHPCMTGGYIFRNGVINIDMDRAIPLTFEMVVIKEDDVPSYQYRILGAYQRNVIKNLKPEPQYVEAD